MEVSSLVFQLSGLQTTVKMLVKLAQEQKQELAAGREAMSMGHMANQLGTELQGLRYSHCRPAFVSSARMR